MNSKNNLSKIFLFTVLIPFTLLSQQYNEKDQKATSIGRIGLSVSSNGVIGNSFRGPYVTKGESSCEYPIGSGIEHLFDGGIWIGANVRGQKLVSTSAAGDDANGYDAGNAGYEFTSTKLLIERSTIENASNYSPLAISHQDFVAEYSDSSTRIPNGGPIIDQHTTPLKITIKQESYAWNFPFADYFVLLNYKITNKNLDTLKDLFVGLWGDFIVRNVKITPPRGTEFFSHSAFGYDDASNYFYAYDYNGDPGFTDSYVAVKVIGGDWRGGLIQPKAFSLWSLDLKKYFTGREVPFDSLRSFIQFWGYRSTDLNLGSPKNDAERYLKMSSSINKTIYDQEVKDKPSNLLSFISIGPIPELAPNETMSLVFGIVAAKKFGDRPSSVNDSTSRITLSENIQWAQRAYNGEDSNGNGKLDDGEDYNNNNKLDRYRLPEPPSPPKIKIIPSNKKVTIYWDKNSENSIDPISRLKDFEGYKIYGSVLTNLSSQSASDKLVLLAEIDSIGNSVGINNGFNSKGAFTKYSEPVKFENDTTKYFYSFVSENLLNGWQYSFSVTSFDEGDEIRGIPSLETSREQNLLRVYPGVVANNNFESGEPYVYPNPFYGNAKWDGKTEREKKIYFANLPLNSEVKIYTSSGRIVDSFNHNGSNYRGEDVRWFQQSGKENVQLSGGEHAWDLISKYDQSLATGLYIYTVKDLETGKIQTGKFVIIK
ncbi:MAG: hypothetical protein O3A55_05655 [Bacteroidetes bacterium]|nr:hypothetical protein [Bacteroidota bacterium]